MSQQLGNDCLICHGGSIGMNPLALNELQAWHYAGHPKRHTQVTGLRLDNPEASTKDTVTSPTETIEDKLNNTLVNYALVVRHRMPLESDPTNHIITRNAAEDIQAIITTETTKARVDEIKRFDVGVPISANAIQSRLAALQKEQS